MKKQHEVPGERFAPQSEYEIFCSNLTAMRNHGQATGIIISHGRSNASERLELAEMMASITETVVIGERQGSRGYYRWPVTFAVTHRILPIQQPVGGTDG
jgi:hypothetical protein